MLRISPVEVRRAGSGGPATPTAIKSWQRRSGEEARRREKEEKEGSGHLI